MVLFTVTRLDFVTRDFTTETRCVINSDQVAYFETRDDDQTNIYFSVKGGDGLARIVVKESLDTIISKMSGSQASA